jgi:outer membrane protein TolC
MKQKKPWFSLLLLCGLLLVSRSIAHAQEDAKTNLVELVAEALMNNPEIDASEAQWEMFVQKARQAGTFEDPMLMLGINNGLVRDPLNFSRDEMTSKTIGISQMVPFFGKRALSREAAEKDALSARARYGERKLELAAMVKETYAGLYAVDRALEIIERSLRVMDDITRYTESRYGVGTGMQQDVLRAQVERSRMLDMQIGLRQQRRSLQATMNRLLFRQAGTPLKTVSELEAPPVTLSAEELTAKAEKSRPQLAGLAAQVAKGKLEERLAKKEYYPDFTFSLEYMQREEAMESPGFDMYAASVSFNLPIQRQRRQAMAAEARAQSRMAMAEERDLQNTIRNGIDDLLGRLDRSAKLIELYRTGIIPQATRSFESAQIAYGNNQADLEMMLESLLTLFRYEREYYEMLADYRMSLARLEALVGTSLAEKQ